MQTTKRRFLIALEWQHDSPFNVPQIQRGQSDSNHRTTKEMTRLSLLAVVAALITSGCAFNKVTMRDGPKETTVRTYAFWPATGSVTSQKVSNAKTTMSVGQTGLEQQGGGTNVVEALKAIDSILSRIP